MDAESHAVLFEKNADELTAPASMAKTMTAEVVFNEIKNGRLNFDSEFMISENAWRKGGGGSGGSAMFAKVNTNVRLEDLLRGLIVQSGNDAAIAIAEGIAGTEDNFARMMNERAKQIGLTKSTFRNATGYGHPEQKATVRELAKLALYIIETYPDLYKIFGEREFTWNKIRQQNRNPLLFLDIGADGLKTGNIDEAGFGLIGSAVQNDQRLIVVVNGLKTRQGPGGGIAQAPRLGLQGLRIPAALRCGTGRRRGSGFRWEQAGAAACVQEACSCTCSPWRRRAGHGSHRLYRTAQGSRPEGCRGGPAPGQPRGHAGLEMPLYANEDIQEGTLSQRALDGLLEFSTGWVRRAFTSLVEGI